MYAMDVESLGGFVMRERGLEPDKTIVQVGLDDGQGHLKIMMSMKERDDVEARTRKKIKYSEEYGLVEFKMAGAKRLIILLIAPTTAERHDNIATYLSLLKIETLDFGYSCDINDLDPSR